MASLRALVDALWAHGLDFADIPEMEIEFTEFLYELGFKSPLKRAQLRQALRKLPLGCSVLQDSSVPAPSDSTFANMTKTKDEKLPDISPYEHDKGVSKGSRHEYSMLSNSVKNSSAGPATGKSGARGDHEKSMSEEWETFSTDVEEDARERAATVLNEVFGTPQSGRGRGAACRGRHARTGRRTSGRGRGTGPVASRGEGSAARSRSRCAGAVVQRCRHSSAVAIARVSYDELPSCEEPEWMRELIRRSRVFASGQADEHGDGRVRISLSLQQAVELVGQTLTPALVDFFWKYVVSRENIAKHTKYWPQPVPRIVLEEWDGTTFLILPLTGRDDFDPARPESFRRRKSVRRG